MKSKVSHWSIPREWVNDTAVIFGGGPSLRPEDVEVAIRRGWRRIAVNNAYILDPAADVLVWGDKRWYEWNRFDLHRHTGPYKITWQEVQPVRGCKYHLLRHAGMPPTVRHLLNDLRLFSEAAQLRRTMDALLRHGRSLLADDPGTIAATNTGQGAINVAYHFGAKRIILTGFDMQTLRVGKKVVHNWHNLHRRDINPDRYQAVFAPAIQAVATLLREKGIEIVNCTPNSKLPGVPILRLEDV